MPFQSVTTECFRLNEFSGLLQLAFGLNLALPILRELAIVPRLPLSRQLTAIESLMGFRKYAGSGTRVSLRSRIESVKRELVIVDGQLKDWVNGCAVVTFIFALSALGWSFYAALDSSCLGRVLSVAITLIHFAPLPISLLILYLKSAAVYKGISDQVAVIKRDALS